MDNKIDTAPARLCALCSVLFQSAAESENCAPKFDTRAATSVRTAVVVIDLVIDLEEKL